MDVLKDAMKELQERLERLEQKRANIKADLDKTEREMVDVKTSLAGLSRLDRLNDIAETLHEVNTAPIGLTDAIRDVLKSKPVRMLPTDIRDALVANGYDITQHSNVVASIHTCLKRLEMRGEILSFSTNGKTVYEWKR